MYWGKSLDQCDPNACFGINFSLFQPKNQQKQKGKIFYNQNRPSPKKELISDTSRSDLRQKRSLKKHLSPNRTPQTTSLKSSTTNNFNRFPLDGNLSPNKFYHRKNDHQVFLARQQLIEIEKQLKNIQNLQTQSSQKSQNQSWVKNVQNYQNSQIKRNINVSSKNQQNYQVLSPVHRDFIKEPVNQVIYGAPYRFNSPQINCNIGLNQPNKQLISPVKFTFQSPPKFPVTEIINRPVSQIIDRPVFVSPKKIVSFQKDQSFNIDSQKCMSPRRIENIHQKKQIISQQFTTIREENQTYYLSKSEIESRNKIVSSSGNSQCQENETKKQQQKKTLLNDIRQVLQTQKEHLSLKLIQFILSPTSQSSVIEGNQNPQAIDLSCEQLMGLSQNQIQSQELKIEESFVENLEMKNYSLSPSQKQCYERRPNHVPSIAIKMIQNKLRSHNYHISEEEINNINFSGSQDQQNQGSKSKVKNQSQSRWKQLYDQKSQSLMQSKENMFPLKLTIQECKSQWVSDSKLPEHKNSQNLDSSLIEILTEQDESNQLKHSRVREVNHEDLVRNNIFRDKTNHHLTNSEHSCQRKSSQKRFRTLVNNKVTFHSILEEESSCSEICQTPRTPEGNKKTINKNIFSPQQNCILSETPTSSHFIDRDESTVIGKYTFQSMQHKSS